MMIWRAIILAGVVVLAAALFAPSDNVKRGSLGYWVNIPAFLANIPTPRPCGDVLYSQDWHDGTKPPIGWVTYDDARTPQEVDATLVSHFTALGCTVPAAIGEFSWDCPNGLRIMDGAREGEVCTEVSVGVFDMSVFGQ